jgi:hypothetical protein
MQSPSCLHIPPINFWMPETIFMGHGMYSVATEPTSTAYFINPTHQSVCLYVYLSYRCKASLQYIPPFGVWQQFVKHVPAAMNTHNRRIVRHTIFYVVHVLTKESLWVCLCIPLSLLGNNSVKTSLQQWRIAGGVIFYVVRAISKESRWLVIPRTSYFLLVPNSTNSEYLNLYWVEWNYIRSLPHNSDYLGEGTRALITQ